jgi:hypothetical protein
MTQKDKHEALEAQLRELAVRVDKISHAQSNSQNVVQASYVKELEGKLTGLSKRLEVLEVTAPPELRSLSCEAVKLAIEGSKDVKGNPYAEFEVLQNWGAPGGAYTFLKGSRIRADHHTGIVGYVKSGLLIGVPSDHKKQIEELRQQRADLKIA